MQKIVRSTIEIIANRMDPRVVLEIGSLQVEGQERIAELRPLFPKAEYIGIDMREGKGVDMVLNAERDLLPKADLIICLDTLEHCRKPWLVMDNIYRSLTEDGVVILAVPFKFQIHDYPSDYWRFTPECVRMMLNRSKFATVFTFGDDIFPNEVIGIGDFCQVTLIDDADIEKLRLMFKKENGLMSKIFHIYYKFKKMRILSWKT